MDLIFKDNDLLDSPFTHEGEKLKKEIMLSILLISDLRISYYAVTHFIYIYI